MVFPEYNNSNIVTVLSNLHNAATGTESLFGSIWDTQTM